MKKIIDFLMDLLEDIFKNIRKKILEEWGFDSFF